MAINPSPRLAMLLLLFHALVASVVYVTVMPLVAKLAIFMLVFLSLLYYLARDALLLLPDSWCEVSVNQGKVSVVTRRGSVFSGQIVSKTTVSPYFTVMHVRLEGFRLSASQTILPDALSNGEFRNLCWSLKLAQ
jgi:hypothetical protein